MPESIDTITVDKALTCGRKWVGYPAFGLFITCFILILFFGVLRIIPNWGIPLGWIFGFFISWIWWRFSITKWRLWAFENVRNVHELKRRAMQENLMWEDSSFIEKMAYKSASDKMRWISIQRKFNQKDIFQDLPNIPEETQIFFSKRKKRHALLTMIACAGIGNYLMFYTEILFLGALLTLIGLFFGIKEYRNLISNEPQIVVNNLGLKTISTPFFHWKDVKNAKVYRVGIGKNIHYYMEYDYPSGKERLQIDELNIRPSELDKRLTIYQGRSECKSKERIIVNKG